MHPKLGGKCSIIEPSRSDVFFGWHSQPPASNVVKLQKKSGKVFYSLVNHELLGFGTTIFSVCRMRAVKCSPIIFFAPYPRKALSQNSSISASLTRLYFDSLKNIPASATPGVRMDGYLICCIFS